MKPHRGPVILVLGIVGLVFCPFFGVAAWAMGNRDLEEMATGQMDPSGADLTKAGRLCGIIGTVILTVGMLGVSLFGLSMLLGRP